MKIKINTKKDWKTYWPGPLPLGAEAEGVVAREDNDTGALIRLRNGKYAQGNAGALRDLPQQPVIVALHMAQVGAAGGRAGRGEAKNRGTEHYQRAAAARGAKPREVRDGIW